MITGDVARIEENANNQEYGYLSGNWDMSLLNSSNASQVFDYIVSGDDLFTGSAYADTINGGAGNHNILGSGGNDYLSGDAGDDSISGGVGDDLIDGGSGIDRAVFLGQFSSYSFAKDTQGRLTVTDSSAARDGIDTITGIEVLVFSDKEVSVSSVSQSSPTTPPTAPQTPPSTPNGTTWLVPSGRNGKWKQWKDLKKSDPFWMHKGKKKYRPNTRWLVDKDVKVHPDYNPNQDVLRTDGINPARIKMLNYDPGTILYSGRNVLAYFPNYSFDLAVADGGFYIVQLVPIVQLASLEG